MTALIQLRGNTAAFWAAANPVLAAREPVIETDTLMYKIGDGVTAWNALPYRELSGLFTSGLTVSAISDPANPASNTLRFYAQDHAGREMPRWIGDTGVAVTVQPSLFTHGVAAIMPASGPAAATIGMTAPTAIGTISNNALTAGTTLTAAQRSLRVTGTTTAGTAAELRTPVAMCYRGESLNGVNTGGFFLTTRFNAATSNALTQFFTGLTSSTAATAGTQVVSLLTNCVMVGWDTNDTNMSIMSNDGTGGCTKISLGSNFPANTPAALYDVTFFSPPNGSFIGYRVRRLDLASTPVAAGILTTDLPTKALPLAWHIYANNSNTAYSAAFDMARMYLETEF